MSDLEQQVRGLQDQVHQLNEWIYALREQVALHVYRDGKGLPDEPSPTLFQIPCFRCEAWFDLPDAAWDHLDEEHGIRVRRPGDVTTYDGRGVRSFGVRP